MKRNRKVTKRMSVVTANATRAGLIIVTTLLMVIVNILTASNCSHLMKAKGEKERELRKLEDARMRESSRWEEMKTPERLELALLRHGLKMNLPRADQNVRLRRDGRPRPGQLSLAKARQTPAGSTAVPAKYRRRKSR